MSSLQLMSMGVMAYLARKTPDHLTKEDRDGNVECVQNLKNILSFGEFPDSLAKIDLSLAWLRIGPGDTSSVGTELRNIVETVAHEASKKRFLYVSSDRVKCLDNSALFGMLVMESFPSAVEDIREAGNCLAAECNTAAVFHLMRVVEWGLRALCADLGMKNVKQKIKKSGHTLYAPIAYADWEKLLDGLQGHVDEKIGRMKRGEKKQELQQFYYPALQDIRGIKDAWRNHVMHTRDEYTREDAWAIMTHVQRLMCSLAKRVAEV